MIWSLYVALRPNSRPGEENTVFFDNGTWDEVVRAAKEGGINQIVMELCGGVHFGSHPELARAGAWTRTRVHQEVRRLREMGIELIPLLNFSATHHQWLGEYARMMSTNAYYRVCRELIEEVAVLFEHPRYIHIGMDEEGDAQFFEKMELVSFRQGELFWHDLQFLIDCVRDTGATPWIWADPCMYHPEAFRAHIPTDDIVLQPWIYYSIKKEHYTPTAGGRELYRQIGEKYQVDFVEDAPIWRIFTEQSMIAANDGYKMVPCASVCFGNEWCHDDIVDYFKSGAPSEGVLGFMSAPWVRTLPEKLDVILESIRLLADVRKKYYGE